MWQSKKILEERISQNPEKLKTDEYIISSKTKTIWHINKDQSKKEIIYQQK